MNRVQSLKIDVNRALNEILIDKEYGLSLLSDSIDDLQKFFKDAEEGKWVEEEK